MRMSSGPFFWKGKAAIGLVDLHRGDADIEHDSVEPAFRGEVVELAEIGVMQAEAVGKLGQKPLPAGDRRGSRSSAITVAPVSRMARL